ncbi:MAG: undecaprenyl-diphosphate phosphatase [Lachnospiraceae bacterium]|nr:undecaprenyl-diphosphate phosphatase [Lachnospiraceae bacterium]
MSIVQAIILGFIQGMTEFLPVSSSGHLAIMQNVFGINTESGVLFDVLLHVATLVSICIVFRKDVIMLIKEFFGMAADLFRKIKEPYIVIVNSSYRKFVLLIIISTVATGVLGIAAKDFVEYAAGSLLIVGICLIVTAIVLFLADMAGDGRKGAKSASYLNAFEIGMAQGVATLPGISRSGATITACLLCGFKKEFAVKYSFLMSIPAILGAAVLELKDISKADLSGSMLLNSLVGMLVAGSVGYVALKVMIAVVKNKKYIFFSIYCFVIGVGAIAANFFVK